MSAHVLVVASAAALALVFAKLAFDGIRQQRKDAEQIQAFLSGGAFELPPGFKLHRLCGAKDQPIDAEGKQGDARNSEQHAEYAGAPRIAGDLEAAADAGVDRVISPLPHAKYEQA